MGLRLRRDRETVSAAATAKLIADLQAQRAELQSELRVALQASSALGEQVAEQRQEIRRLEALLFLPPAWPTSETSRLLQMEHRLKRKDVELARVHALLDAAEGRAEDRDGPILPHQPGWDQDFTKVRSGEDLVSQGVRR